MCSGLRSPVLALADSSWLDLKFGQRIRASGRLQPARGRDLAAVLLASADPQVTRAAVVVQRGVGAVRGGLVEAVAPLPEAERALVPALVDGDDTAMPPDVVLDFQTTGLTHLLAVSGSNLTLVLAFVLVVGRWAGVRGRGTVAVGVVAVVFFVLLARPQPSVLRAAAMGVVALAGLSSGGRRRGVRALCVAVVVPGAAGPRAGTLGRIPALDRRHRRASCCWPRLARPAGPMDAAALAEAIAVPLAAQIACTPAIAAISAQVSLVAVMANVLAAPAVGPATVLGLVAGLVALLTIRWPT